MQELAYPLAFGQWHLKNDRLVCHLPQKTVDITAPSGLLAAVLELCNGRMDWREVAGHLARHWAADSVQAFLSDLSREGVLVDAGLAASSAQRSTQRLRPGRGEWGVELPSHAASVSELLRPQDSRTFSDAPVPANSLGLILSAVSTSQARWVVVALRSLPAVQGATEGLGPGVYEACFHSEGGVSFLPTGSDDPYLAWRLFSDPRPLTFASVLIVPVWEPTMPAPAASFEAGQCLLGARLMAARLQVGCSIQREIPTDAATDFLRRHVAHGSAGPAPAVVHAALLLGMEPSAREAEQDRLACAMMVRSANTTPAGPAARLTRNGFSYAAGPIRLGAAEILAGGRDAEPRKAAAKAEAEAWERCGWAMLGETVEGRATDLTGAMNPCMVVAYEDAQYGRPDFPLKPYSARRRYVWASGIDVHTEERALLPAECVYALTALPEAFRRRAFTNTSTSGVAAWTDAEGALCRATLELIERDAFLRAWIAQEPMPRVAAETLPSATCRRIAQLEQAGYRIEVMQLASTLAPVFAVFIQSTTRPFTAITAAADLQCEVALVRALDEAEGRAIHAEVFPAQRLQRPSDISGLEEINRLYQTRRFYRRADFFAEGPVSQRFGESPASCKDWPAVKARLALENRRLIAFDLTPSHASIHQGRTPLRVIRAVVPGLIPIWFQPGLEPAGLKAYQQAALYRKGRAARVPPSFIHPFT